MDSNEDNIASNVFQKLINERSASLKAVFLYLFLSKVDIAFLKDLTSDGQN